MELCAYKRRRRGWKVPARKLPRSLSLNRSRRQPLVRWHGIGSDGVAAAGWSMTHDRRNLARQLALDGITLIKARKHSIPLFGRADIYRFLEQISSLLNAGVPILDALELVRQDKISRRLEAIFSGIIENLKSGLPLSDSSAPFIRKSDAIVLQAMILGEKSGKLDEVLDRLLSQQRKSARIRSQLAQAVVYPLILTVTSTVVVVLMMVWAVPQFKSIYADFGTELPAYTLSVISISEFLVSDGVALSLWLLAITAGLAVVHQTSPACRRLLAHAQLRLPLIGRFLRIRFYRQFAADVNLVYRAGMPLGEALSWLPSTSDHPGYRAVIRHVCENLSDGMSLNESLKSTDFFPPFVIQAIRVGENSGSLDRAFERIERFYDDALTNTAEKLIKLFEPLLIITLASIIGFLLVAMYLPMFNLGFVL